MAFPLRAVGVSRAKRHGSLCSETVQGPWALRRSRFLEPSACSGGRWPVPSEVWLRRPVRVPSVLPLEFEDPLDRALATWLGLRGVWAIAIRRRSRAFGRRCTGAEARPEGVRFSGMSAAL